MPAITILWEPKPVATVLLRDTFDTDVAEGAVNGTAVTGVGTTRLVIDASSHVAVKLGELLFDNGGGTTDPGIRYGPYTRTPGLCVIAHIREDQLDATPSAIFQVGWDDNNGGAVEANRLRFNVSAALQTAFALYAGAYANVGAYAGYILYSVAVVILETKAVYVIKGGAFTDWTILGTSPLHAATSLYAAVNAFNRAGAVKTIGVAELPAIWQVDTIADSALSSNAKSVLNSVAPMTLHTTAAILALFAQTGSQVGLDRIDVDTYWFWQDMGGGRRWYVKFKRFGSANNLYDLAIDEIRTGAVTVDTILNDTESVWTYAISVLALGQIGNAHGNDFPISLSFAVDGSPVTLSDGQSATGVSSVVITRVSELRDNSSVVLATVTVTHTMTPSTGLTTALSIDWITPEPAQGQIGMRPYADTGADVGFQVAADGAYYDMTQDSLGVTYDSPLVDTDCLVAFKRGGNTAILSRTTDGHLRNSHHQARDAIFNKMYMTETTDLALCETNYRVRYGDTGVFLI